MEQKDMHTNVNNVLDTLNRVKDLRWKEIIDGISKVMFLVFFALFIKFLINPRPTIEYIIDLHNAIQNQTHKELVDLRLQNTPVINSYLDSLRIEVDDNIDRAFVLEFHNGNSNASGLPFYYADMTYESLENESTSIRDNWYSVSLTRYNIFRTCFENSYFISDTASLQDLDQRLYYKMNEDHITFIALISMLDKQGNQVGILGVSSSADNVLDIDRKQVLSKLYKYSTRINPLLLAR